MLITPKDRILIVAPHPDDEAIGCGGLLIKYGSKCDIMLLTDGRKGYLSTDQVNEEDLIVERENELRRMAQRVGVQTVTALHIPDGTLKLNLSRVKHEDISQYTMIFVPNRYERHKDHSVVTDLFIRMIKKEHLTCSLYEYEVWSPLSNPTDFLDISNIIHEKEDLISFYKTQLKYTDYIRMAACLNGYRGAGQKTEYAEAYSKVINKSLARKVYSALPFSLRKAFHKIIKK